MPKQLIKVVTKLTLVSVTLLLADIACADTVDSIADNANTTMSGVAKMMQSVGLVFGIGFILASFFRFQQYKQNPQQVPISQGLSLLVIGAGLCLFPLLIPTATSVITGTTATDSVSKLNGSQIEKLTGGSSKKMLM